MAFTIWALPHAVALMLSAGLGTYVLSRDGSKPVNRAFVAWMATFAVWSLGELGLRTAEDAGSALFWAKFIYLGVFFMGPAFAHFVFRLVEKRVSAALLYLPWALFLPLLLTDLFIGGLSQDAFGFHTNYGMLFPLFAVPFMAIILYAWHLLWKARSAVQKPLLRKKVDIVLYTTIIAIIGGGITDVLLPGIGIYGFSVANLLSAIMALGIGYAFIMGK